MTTEEIHGFAREMARRSGEIIKSFFLDSALSVEAKADASPVTEADRRAEELMRGMIADRFPGHGVIGEEHGAEKSGAEFVWVLDPIDGTIAFTTGCPLFGTLIGLLHRGVPVYGSIHQPILGQYCWGDGERCFLDDRRVSVRQVASLADATLLSSDFRNIARHQDAGRFEAVAEEVKYLRTWGDCYGYLLVATGHADIMVDPIMNPWDLLPVIPVIQGAGGIITGWDGGDPLNATSAVAAGPKLHGEVIARLAG